MQPIPKPESAINSWQQTKPTNLPLLFYKQDVPVQDGIRGNTGYPNQFSKILGIDFGVAHQDFVDFLTKEQSPDPALRKKLFMVMAANNGEFNIYFEASDPTAEEGKKIQYFESDLSNGGRRYSMLPQPGRLVESRFGVSSELRNQFVYNWQISPVSVMGDLFYGRTLPKPVTESALSGALAGLAFPRFEGLVRAHKYVIRDKNMDTLKNIVSKESNITVSLGINTSDLFISRDMFTFIVEVKDQLTQLGGVTVNRTSLGSSGSQEIEIGAEIDFGTGGDALPLTVTLGVTGVAINFNNGEFVTSHWTFNQQIEIPFDKKDENGESVFVGRGVLWVTPRFINLRIEKVSDGKIEGAMHALISLDPEPANVPEVETTYGETQYLEFVHACPPFCGGGDGG